MNIKNKGFTLIEILVVLSISSIGVITGYKILKDNISDENAKKIAYDMNLIISSFDLKLNNDGFHKDKWNKYESIDYSFSNKEQVNTFIKEALIAFKEPNCGKLSGWKPVKGDATEEAYKDEYALIPCLFWEEKTPLNLNSKIKLNRTFICGLGKKEIKGTQEKVILLQK